MFPFSLCRPFVVDFVDALVVAVFGLCVNYILIVLLDSRTATGLKTKQKSSLDLTCYGFHSDKACSPARHVGLTKTM